MEISKKPYYMFEKSYIDYFFRWHWWVAPMLFLPIASTAFLYSVLSLKTQISVLFLSALIGLFLWTLFEYMLHRFIFHFIAKNNSLQHLHYVVHGMHHAYPNDAMRVIFPPFGSAIFGILVALAIMAILPLAMALNVFGGFILGYCWYEFIHYASHHINWPYAWLRTLKRNHLRHHNNIKCKNANFGVTTHLWDLVFKSYVP